MLAITIGIIGITAPIIYKIAPNQLPTFFGLVSIAFVIAFFRPKDPYGLFHLDLNRLPHDDPTTPPRTEWLNMGYWKNTSIFPEACRALALKLIQESQLKPGGKVLDVGHGTGESLILLLSDSTIPCPSSIIGITSLPSHHHRSQQRVKHLRLNNTGFTRCSNTQVHLLAGDAVWKENAIDHPLHPSSDATFDAILALDCAYHFNTRHAFLVQSFHKLSPQGRIALADICFTSDARHSYMTLLLGSVLRMVPKQNIISAEDYVHVMSEIGYVDIHLEDISEHVFPGFSKFLKSRGVGWWVFGIVMEWFTNTGVRFVIVSGSKP